MTLGHETDVVPSISEVAKKLTDRDPSARIVGSLGRYSIMGLSLPEFRPNGERRDIDYFNVSEGNKALDTEHKLDGIELDRDFNKWVHTESNGTYLVHPSKEALHVEIHQPEEVFAPYSATHQGLDIVTLRPEVLGKLHIVKRPYRPKDKVSAAQYGAHLAATSSNNKLPNELLEPFDEFAQMVSNDRSLQLRGRLRNGYHRVMPNELRKKIKISRFL